MLTEDLDRIKEAESTLADYLKNGFITESDIMQLFNETSNYGINIIYGVDYKTKILRMIYNCPFILCNVDNLSRTLKQELNKFLHKRYNMELDELDLYLNEGELSFDEYLDKKEILKLYYFGDSKKSRKVKKKIR